MKSIDGLLEDFLWFSLTEPEKAGIAYKVGDVMVRLSEVNLGVIGCLTVKHSLWTAIEGSELFIGRVSLSLSRMIQHTAKENCVD